MNDETRKLAITIAAAIFAAGALTDWDGKRSPFLAAGVANAVEKAKLVLSTLDLEGERIGRLCQPFFQPCGHYRDRQQVKGYHRVSPDVIVLKERDHFFLCQRFDFRSAIGGVIQLRHAGYLEQMVQDDGLQPFEVLRALISVEMGAGCFSP